MSYAAAFYGNQLKRGGKWKNLKKVIAINLLGGATNHWRETESQELKRHYKFASNVDGTQHEIEALQLIQYNLNSPKIDALADGPLKEWLQFWRSAHTKTKSDAAVLNDKAVKAAYNKMLVAELPMIIRQRYVHEVNDYQRFSQHIQHQLEQQHEKSLKEGRQEGRQEEKLTTALKMLQKRMPDEQILDLTEVTQDQLDQLKQSAAQQQTQQQ